jgi:hypothetical protein
MINGRGFLSEYHGSEYGSNIRPEKVSAHTGYVAYVITYVIGDGGGVAGIVFGDTGFYFSYEVGAYVGGLGIDTTTDTGEEGNRLSA